MINLNFFSLLFIMIFLGSCTKSNEGNILNGALLDDYWKDGAIESELDGNKIQYFQDGTKGYSTTAGGYFIVTRSNHFSLPDNSELGGLSSYQDFIYLLINRTDNSSIKWKDIYRSDLLKNEWVKVCSIPSNNLHRFGFAKDENYFYIGAGQMASTQIKIFNENCDEVNHYAIEKSIISDHLVKTSHEIFYTNLYNEETQNYYELESFDGQRNEMIQPTFTRLGKTYNWYYENRAYTASDFSFWGIKSHDTSWSLWKISNDLKVVDWGMLPHREYPALKDVRFMASAQNDSTLILASDEGQQISLVFLNVESF